jgi:hypothetical protein
MSGKKDQSKILSFNNMPVDFSFEDVGAEELERRLELAIIPLVMDFFGCTNFTGNCVGFTGDCNGFQ